jgi:hypothetical protein
MTPMLCKVLGHKYSYYWICTRCGDHAGMRHVTEIVRAAVQEAKKEAAAQPETGAEDG